MHTKSVPHFASKLSDQSYNDKYANFSPKTVPPSTSHQCPPFLPPLPPPMTGRSPRSGCPPPARPALATLHRAALPAPRGGLHLLLVHHLHGHHLTSLLHPGDQLSDQHVVTIILLPLFSAHMSHINCRPVYICPSVCRRCVRADGRRRTELRTGVRPARTVPPLCKSALCAHTF